MNWQFSIIYGVIQGLTEFLPVSSSGHLALLPYLLHFSDPGAVFDLLIHVGTALAVIIYFRRDLWQLAIAGLQRKGRQFNYLINLGAATMVSILAALLLKDFAAQMGRNLPFIIFNWAFFGILLFLSDYFAPQSGKADDLLQGPSGWKVALLLGLVQVLALFPGVSRSGIVFTLARSLGLSRMVAAHFSFLLSLPLILGGAVMEVGDGDLGVGNAPDIWYLALLGMLVAFGVGIFSIHFFLRIVGQFGTGVFALYRVLLAAGVYWFVM